MTSIDERPPEVADRRVPGHWEGDLLVGRAAKTAMGTLVERTSRYLIPVPLPTGKQAEGLKDALLTVAADLPAHLLRSLTWDCGSEMAAHAAFTLATDSRCTSPTPTHPGNAAPTRTPTGGYASTSPRAPTSLTTRTTCGPSSARSTADPVGSSAGGNQQKSSPNSSPAGLLPPAERGECCQRLVDDPRHPGLSVHPVQGHPGVWEAYVDQGNRVTFHHERDPDCIVMRNNCNHDILRQP